MYSFRFFSFNPRAREGRDPMCDILAALNTNVSIHAPVKGATKTIILGKNAYNVSIHAPVKGATSLVTDGNWNGTVSIHAPVKGATRVCTGYTG